MQAQELHKNNIGTTQEHHTKHISQHNNNLGNNKLRSIQLNTRTTQEQHNVTTKTTK